MAPAIASSSRPPSQPRRPTGQRKQRLEPPVGFLVRAAPICAQANRLTASTKNRNTKPISRWASRSSPCRASRPRAAGSSRSPPTSARCDHADDVGKRADAREPHDQAGALRAQRLRDRRGEQAADAARRSRASGADRCRCRVARRSVPPTASSSTLAAAGSSRTSGWAPVNGRSFLGPPQRGRPAQPAGAGGGVGDHSQRQEEADRCPAELERHPACRGELARERAHAHEHGHDRRRREGQLGRPARGQAG